ncbi:uncharacterized protein LOC103887849 [Papio anubis]|uniref:uncharacterized protein LOC103887849 n=1 Tax=Papio anubis TaxID=9555 RepID=UPI0012AEABC0|nr:uncharacterized protein LOC103887849 [Papio anubis]XP_031507825.1 uncharacterized protein LOC103887849 [Papio anubis]
MEELPGFEDQAGSRGAPRHSSVRRLPVRATEPCVCPGAGGPAGPGFGTDRRAQRRQGPACGHGAEATAVPPGAAWRPPSSTPCPLGPLPLYRKVLTLWQGESTRCRVPAVFLGYWPAWSLCLPSHSPGAWLGLGLCTLEAGADSGVVGGISLDFAEGLPSPWPGLGLLGDCAGRLGITSSGRPAGWSGAFLPTSQRGSRSAFQALAQSLFSPPPPPPGNLLIREALPSGPASPAPFPGLHIITANRNLVPEFQESCSLGGKGVDTSPGSMLPTPSLAVPILTSEKKTHTTPCLTPRRDGAAPPAPTHMDRG